MKVNNFFEEVEVVGVEFGIGEVGDGGVMGLRDDGYENDIGDDGVFDVVEYEYSCEDIVVEDVDLYYGVVYFDVVGVFVVCNVRFEIVGKLNGYGLFG